MKPLMFDAETLRCALRSVSLAMKNDPTHPGLNGVCLECTGAEAAVTLNATDGYWMARWTFLSGVEGDGAPFRMMIGADDVSRLKRLLRLEGYGDVRVWPGRRLVRIERSLLALEPYAGPEPPAYGQRFSALGPHDGLSGIGLNPLLLRRVSKAFRLARRTMAMQPLVLQFGDDELSAIHVTVPHITELAVILMPVRVAFERRNQRTVPAPAPAHAEAE